MKQDLSPAKVNLTSAAFPEVVQHKIPIFELMSKYGDHFTRFNVLLESNIKRSGKTASEYLNVFSISGFNTPLHEAMSYSPWMLETLIKYGSSCDLEGDEYWKTPLSVINVERKKLYPLSEGVKPRPLLQGWASRCAYNDQVDRTTKLRILLANGCDPNDDGGNLFGSLFFHIKNLDQLFLLFEYGIDVNKYLDEEDQGICMYRHEQIDRHYRSFLASKISQENLAPSAKRKQTW